MAAFLIDIPTPGGASRTAPGVPSGDVGFQDSQEEEVQYDTFREVSR